MVPLPAPRCVRRWSLCEMTWLRCCAAPSLRSQRPSLAHFATPLRRAHQRAAAINTHMVQCTGQRHTGRLEPLLPGRSARTSRLHPPPQGQSRRGPWSSAARRSELPPAPAPAAASARRSCASVSEPRSPQPAARSPLSAMPLNRTSPTWAQRTALYLPGGTKTSVQAS